MSDSVERFTETVENYIKYRPSYPEEILPIMAAECHLTKDTIIADIGSGTGFLSKLFLEHGNPVYGVEPNEAMRLAAQTYLATYPKFGSVAGSAEATTLADHSIDLITAGTAFHWFDAKKSKLEFKRILKSSGFALLIWNVRNKQQSIFLQDYENLILHYGKDYQQSPAQQFDKTAVQDFFNPHAMKTASFVNSQHFAWDGLKGRLLSTSYSLRETDTNYNKMIHELRIIFDRHQQNGMVEFLYDTKLYYGQMND